MFKDKVVVGSDIRLYPEFVVYDYNPKILVGNVCIEINAYIIIGSYFFVDCLHYYVLNAHIFVVVVL